MEGALHGTEVSKHPACSIMGQWEDTIGRSAVVVGAVYSIHGGL